MNTLQIPHNVVKVEGFSYSEGQTSFNAIKYVVGDNNGKWKTIENGAFSLLPELTSIILPKTISSIGYSAFNDCQS